MPGPEAFSLVLALGIAGVVLGAVLSLWAAPEKNSPKPV